MFDPKVSTEEIRLGFDFTKDLAAGESVQSATVTICVLHGVDAAAAAMLSGAPTITSPKVSQLVINGVKGVIYYIHCKATTTPNAQKLELGGDFLVEDPC